MVLRLLFVDDANFSPARIDFYLIPLHFQTQQINLYSVINNDQFSPSVPTIFWQTIGGTAVPDLK